MFDAALDERVIAGESESLGKMGTPKQRSRGICREENRSLTQPPRNGGAVRRVGERIESGLQAQSEP